MAVRAGMGRVDVGEPNGAPAIRGGKAPMPEVIAGDDPPVPAFNSDTVMDVVGEAARSIALPYDAAYTLVDQRVRVRGNRADLQQAMSLVWRPFADSATSESARRYTYDLIDLAQAGIDHPWAARFVLLREGRVLYGSARGDDLVDYADWHAASTALTAASTYAVFHSAVLDDHGRGLLLPAASGSGKTTLTAALVCAGFGYLSDEAALVDPATRRVHAYPKPLSIKRPLPTARLLALPDEVAREAPRELGRVWHLDPTRLAADCRREATEVRAIIFPRYEPHGRTALQSLSRSEAALRLLRCGVNDRARPPHGVALATALAADAMCYDLVVNDLAAAVALVADVCARGAA